MRHTCDNACRLYRKNRHCFNLRSWERLFLFQARSSKQTYPFYVLQSNPSVSFCAELGGVAESITYWFHDDGFRDFVRNVNESTNRALHSWIIRELLKVLKPFVLGTNFFLFYSYWMRQTCVDSTPKFEKWMRQIFQSISLFLHFLDSIQNFSEKKVKKGLLEKTIQWFWTIKPSCQLSHSGMGSPFFFRNCGLKSLDW